MTVKAAIVVFPGSNCEQDCVAALSSVGTDARYVWHAAERLDGADLVVLPGGFAHGDYLRTGAVARFSPIMEAVREHADAGGLVLGICNGFQILCEAGLLPGALRKNEGLKFLCRWTNLRVDNADTAFTNQMHQGQVLRIPINHFEGNWYCDAQTLERMRSNDQIVLRYVENPNGALDDAAAICNERGNVFGMMPHPERAADALLGSEDGKLLFDSIIRHVDAAISA